MKAKYKRYLKLNIMSIFFIAVSFISVTLAWFAYSGMASVATEIGVKAWYIEFQKDAQTVSNDIVISLSDVYPGMDTVSEVVSIKNKGDSDSQINYAITSARILDDEYNTENGEYTSESIENILSHEYPFHVNINLSKNYAVAKDGESTFTVSVSWPLDSGIDDVDSSWGQEAYVFQDNEKKEKDKDASYQIRSSIKIVISVNAEQYVRTELAADMEYNVGDLVLYDVISDRVCNSLDESENCIKTYVLSVNSKIGDHEILLLPDVYDSYTLGTIENYDTIYNEYVNNWNVTTRKLTVEDVLNVISTDVLNSYMVRENLSDSIIGNLKYSNSMNNTIQQVIDTNGYFTYNNNTFGYLSSQKCYWTSSSYNSTKTFAFTKFNDTRAKLYGEDNNRECSIIPKIVLSK